MTAAIHKLGAAAVYYRIATAQARRYYKLDVRLARLAACQQAAGHGDTIAGRGDLLCAEREQAALVTVVFAAMCIEAFLYDYAAQRLGVEFARDNLSKLDIRSKYLLYPRLGCGRAPERTSAAYSKLDSVMKLREDMQHFTNLASASTFRAGLSHRLRAGVDEALECILLVAGEFDRLHDTGEGFRQALLSSIQERVKARARTGRLARAGLPLYQRR